MALWAQPPPVTSACHILVLVCTPATPPEVPAASLLTQLPKFMPRNAEDDGPNGQGSASHVGATNGVQALHV